eukprot:1139865-Pelagomonas_calceolata.AAC.1
MYAFLCPGRLATWWKASEGVSTSWLTIKESLEIPGGGFLFLWLPPLEIPRGGHQTRVVHEEEESHSVTTLTYFYFTVPSEHLKQWPVKRKHLVAVLEFNLLQVSSCKSFSLDIMTVSLDPGWTIMASFNNKNLGPGGAQCHEQQALLPHKQNNAAHLRTAAGWVMVGVVCTLLCALAAVTVAAHSMKGGVKGIKSTKNEPLACPFQHSTMEQHPDLTFFVVGGLLPASSLQPNWISCELTLFNLLMLLSNRVLWEGAGEEMRKKQKGCASDELLAPSVHLEPSDTALVQYV